MQNGRVVVALHSLNFRVHTRVLLTLFVACAIAGIMWADHPARPPISTLRATRVSPTIALSTE